MSPANGHADAGVGGNVSQSPDHVLAPLPAATLPNATQLTSDQITGVIRELEVPFDPCRVEWRVTSTGKNGKPRGLVIPYADQRAYTDRLNTVFSPAGWTREYQVHTSANFQPGKDAKTVAKVFVTCKVTIFGLNSHSATGEEWADDANAGTSAEAQAFKRACCCFGLGRYLYYFSGDWVDLDDRNRPKSVPKLPKWATPEGWRQGFRPQQGAASPSAPATPVRATKGKQSNAIHAEDLTGLIRQIEAMQGPLQTGIYRGLLKTVARAWKPDQIQEPVLLQKVLTHMQAAHRGLLRLDAALNTLGADALQPFLRKFNLRSLDNVDNLETLKQLVLALEEAAAKTGH